MLVIRHHFGFDLMHNPATLQCRMALVRGQTGHLEDVHEALSEVQQALSGAFTSPPTSDQAPYDQDAATLSLKTTGRYRCGGNLTWVNFTASATPGIPYNRAAIQRLVASCFGRPTACFPATVVVGGPPQLSIH
jgi:hypothetical protein